MSFPPTFILFFTILSALVTLFPNPVFGWKVEATIATTCSKPILSRLFNDYSTWNRWDPDLKKATLDAGSEEDAEDHILRVGETGVVNMKDGTSHPFTITSLDDGYFAYTTPIGPSFATCNLEWYWEFGVAGSVVEGVKTTGAWPTCAALELVAKGKSLKAFQQALLNLKTICETN